MTSTSIPATAAVVDAAVAGRVEQFLVGLDARLPGLVESVRVTGSGLTDDWQESCSDIDLVIVVRRPVTSADADVLTEWHAATKSSNAVDGVYLTAAQLSAGPEDVESAPQVVNGDFVLGKMAGQLCWVTWHELAASPVAIVSGPGTVRWDPPRSPVGSIRSQVAAYCRQNLATYWTQKGDEAAAYCASHSPVQALDASLVVWVVLGPPRLIATIRTGAVVSKTAGGILAAETWPDYADLVERCIRSRRGAAEEFTVGDLQAATSLLRLVVAEGARHAINTAAIQ